MSQKNKKHKQLPLHFNEAHPLTCAGEANKQFVIAMIALAAIVVLALLLLFSEQFVGKAIYLGDADTGGITLVPEQPVLKDQSFTLNVGANIKGKTKIINFALPLPQGSCSGVTVNNLLTKAFQITAKCENNKILYEYYTLGFGDNLDALSGAQDIAEIKFSAAAVGDYQFNFEKITYFDLDSNKEVSLTTKTFSLKVTECKPGQTLCNGKCVDLQTNKNNCGNCNSICKDLESCAAGKCVAQCTSGTPDNCNNVCVNIKTDMKNCGGCGKVCEGLQSCVAGKCVEIKKCGNNIFNEGEECDSPPDNSGFFSKNCNALGFDGGKIKCTTQCKLDNSSCGAKLVPAEEPEQKEGLIVKGQLDIYKFCDNYSVNSNDYEICIVSIDPNSVKLEIIDKVTNKKIQTNKLMVDETYSFGDNIMLSISSLSAPPYTVKFYFSIICGNSLLDPNEECDSPPDNSGFFTKGCNALGFDGGTIQCTKECKFDTSKCNPKPGEKLLIEDQDKDGVPADEDCNDSDPYLGACSVNEACVNGKCTLCGNNLLDEGEKCDSINLGGKSCFDFDFDGGLLQCSLDCTFFDTSKCNPKPVQPAVDAGGVQAPAVGGAEAGGVLPAAGAVNVTGAAVPTAQAVTGAVQGTKITLTDIAPLNNVYSTQITAAEDFTNEVTVYTVLYGVNNKVLSIKLEKIEAGLKKGASYTAIVNYPLGNVNKKSVIVYDVELKPTIYGKLEKAYMVG